MKKADKILASFPVLGTHIINTKVNHAVAAHIMGLMPKDFFRTVYVNENLGMSNPYKRRSRSDSEKIIQRDKISKLEKPSFYMDCALTNISGGDTPLAQLPENRHIVNMLRKDLRPYEILFRDEKGIEIFRSELYRKIPFEITMDFRSKSDQETYGMLMHSTFNFYKGKLLRGLKAANPMPNGLMVSLRKVIYGVDWSDDQYDDSFIEYMRTNSNGAIDVRSSTIDRDKKHFYELREYNKVFFKMEEPSFAQEKNNMIIGEYPVSMSGYVELYTPMNYIVSLPKMVIGGNKVGDFLFRDNEFGPDGTLSIVTVTKGPEMEKFPDGEVESRFTRIAYSNFLLSGETDEFPLAYIFKEDFEQIVKDGITYLENGEFYETYYIKLFCDDAIVDDYSWEIDTSRNVIIRDGNVNKEYTIIVYLDLERFKRFVPVINTRKTKALAEVSP